MCISKCHWKVHNHVNAFLPSISVYKSTGSINRQVGPELSLTSWHQGTQLSHDSSPLGVSAPLFLSLLVGRSRDCSSEQESSAASSEPSRCAATAAMILLFEVAGLERGGFRDITFEVQLCAALYEFQLWCCITVAFVDQPFCRKVVNPVPEVGTLEAQHFGKIARWLHGIT